MKSDSKSMRFFKKLAWIFVAIQMAVVVFILCTFQVKDMTLSKGDVYDLNENWTLVREDGSREAIDSLPYVTDCAVGEVVVLEGTIPREYWGLTLFFLSADKELKIYIDDELVYSFGVDDERVFGHTPGSIEVFADIPAELSEGKIRMEMVSPYENYAANIGSMKIAKRDIAILDMLKQNMWNLCCNIVILVAGVILGVLAVAQKTTRQNTSGMAYLSMYFLFLFLYHSIETKMLTIFYGNQTLYSALIFLILMIAPLFLILYFANTLPESYEKYFKWVLVVASINIVAQLVLQISNVVDFMNMAFMSHALIFVAICVAGKMFYDLAKQGTVRNVWIQMVGLFIMLMGALIDLARVYTVKVGDLGKFSRYSAMIFGIIMVTVHLQKIIYGYSEKIAEGARLLQREIEFMEMQNKQLILAKAEAEAAREEAEIARQEAQQANEAKSRFLANMSHEIRTPINAVLGMDSMILKESKEPDIREYANDIQHAGRNLLAIINDILDFSKIESGKLELFPAEYDFASLLNDSYNMVLMRALEKNLELRVENDPTLPAKMYGDEIRIRQIVTNLLTNAVKYTKAGSVTLRVTWEPLEGKQMLLWISVKDTGVGITPEDQEKLFDSFQRIEEKNHRNIEGTGLGLTITKQLVDLMKGSIRVESEYQKGSEFTVEIPQEWTTEERLGDFSVKYIDTTTENQQYQNQLKAPRARILVVDDVAMNLKVMAGLLKSTKIQIDVASSGQECLEKIKEQEYHLIFLDHMMPEMDGIETLQHMRNMPVHKNENTPIVMLTANAIIGAKEEYLQVGFHDYLSKPVREAELEDILRRYLPQELIEDDVTDMASANAIDMLADDEEKNIEADLLAGLEFLDVEMGVTYCAGSEEFYREMLLEYIASPKLDAMRESYEAKDWEAYRIVVHALKSTSLTLGMAELSEMAKQVELAVKKGELTYVLEHHEELMKAYHDMICRLRKVLVDDEA